MAIKLQGKALKGVTFSDEEPGKATRTSGDEWTVSNAQALMDGEAVIEDEDGNDVTIKVRQVLVVPEDESLDTNSERWMRATKSRGGALANYIRAHYEKELKERGLKVSSQFLKGQCIKVMLRPDKDSEVSTDGQSANNGEAT